MCVSWMDNYCLLTTHFDNQNWSQVHIYFVLERWGGKSVTNSSNCWTWARQKGYFRCKVTTLIPFLNFKQNRYKLIFIQWPLRPYRPKHNLWWYQYRFRTYKNQEKNAEPQIWRGICVSCQAERTQTGVSSVWRKSIYTRWLSWDGWVDVGQFAKRAGGTRNTKQNLSVETAQVSWVGF